MNHTGGQVESPKQWERRPRGRLPFANNANFVGTLRSVGRKTGRMPRISAEARAAAMWRTGGSGPRPPRHLPAAERRVWAEIVAGYPLDYFKAGSQFLLEQLCTMIVAARLLVPLVEQNPADPSVAIPYLKLCQGCATHATKLRLTVQSSVHCRSGMLDEPGQPDNAKGLLFGDGEERF
jgi:hypothetical protein